MNLRIKALKDFANLTNALFQKWNYLCYVRICTQIRFGCFYAVFYEFFFWLAFKKHQKKIVHQDYFIWFNFKFTLIDIINLMESYSSCWYYSYSSYANFPLLFWRKKIGINFADSSWNWFEQERFCIFSSSSKVN
jgi:hypothetical protein